MAEVGPACSMAGLHDQVHGNHIDTSTSRSLGLLAQLGAYDVSVWLFARNLRCQADRLDKLWHSRTDFFLYSRLVQTDTAHAQ